MGESKPNDDPLAEAMSMLDAVANGSKDFEDFVIDSDEDSNDDANLLDDLNLTNDLVDLGLDDSRDTAISSDAPYDVRNYGGEGGATGFKAPDGKRGNALPVPSGTNIDQFSGEAFVHPLQMMGVKDLDPLSQGGLHAPGAGDRATNSYSEVNNRVLGNVVPSGAATTGGEAFVGMIVLVVFMFSSLESLNVNIYFVNNNFKSSNNVSGGSSRNDIMVQLFVKLCIISLSCRGFRSISRGNRRSSSPRQCPLF